MGDNDYFITTGNIIGETASYEFDLSEGESSTNMHASEDLYSKFYSESYYEQQIESKLIQDNSIYFSSELNEFDIENSEKLISSFQNQDNLPNDSFSNDSFSDEIRKYMKEIAEYTRKSCEYDGYKFICGA